MEHLAGCSEAEIELFFLSWIRAETESGQKIRRISLRWMDCHIVQAMYPSRLQLEFPLSLLRHEAEAILRIILHHTLQHDAKRFGGETYRLSNNT